MKLKLVLENGNEFHGFGIGHLSEEGFILGEVVFNTGMTGHQEILTDPSYCDQLVTLTYPLIGNYGFNREDYESLIPHFKGVILKENCALPSNYRNEFPLEQFLIRHKKIGITGIDTRELTRILRGHGTMKGIIVKAERSTNECQKFLSASLLSNQIQTVSTKSPTHFPGSNGLRVVLMDFGYKKSILSSLQKRGCDVIVVPYNIGFEEIKTLSPDGILLSNGPGDPKSVPEVLPVIKKLQEHFPLLGICMGHQLFALANEADTEKLKFGHRGCNHPVKDLKLDRVFITSQNHGYTVKPKSIENTSLELTQINLNDDTIEGLKHKNHNAFSVQYHPEANPGPEDSAYIFDLFINSMKQGVAHAHK